MKKWQWKDSPNTLAVFMDILLNTNYVDSYSHGVLVKRGQCITGEYKMAKNCGLTRGATREAIKRLKSTNEIDVEATNKYTLITVIKWDEYQGGTKNTTNKKLEVATNEQPTNNQRTTTNEEYKELKEVKEKDLKISSKQKIGNPVDYYEENFRRTITQSELVRLQGWLEEYPTDVINYAFDQCVFQNVKTFRYFEGILKAWHSAGVKSLQDAESQVADHDKSKAAKKSYSNHQDVLPKYMTESYVETEASKEDIEKISEMLKTLH